MLQFPPLFYGDSNTSPHGPGTYVVGQEPWVPALTLFPALTFTCCMILSKSFSSARSVLLNPGCLRNHPGSFLKTTVLQSPTPTPVESDPLGWAWSPCICENILGASSGPLPSGSSRVRELNWEEVGGAGRGSWSLGQGAEDRKAVGELSLETLPPGVVPAGCGPPPGSREPGPHPAEKDMSPIGKAWGAWASRWAGGSLLYPHSGLGSALPSSRQG